MNTTHTPTDPAAQVRAWKEPVIPGVDIRKIGRDAQEIFGGKVQVEPDDMLKILHEFGVALAALDAQAAELERGRAAIALAGWAAELPLTYINAYQDAACICCSASVAFEDHEDSCRVRPFLEALADYRTAAPPAATDGTAGGE